MKRIVNRLEHFFGNKFSINEIVDDYKTFLLSGKININILNPSVLNEGFISDKKVINFNLYVKIGDQDSVFFNSTKNNATEYVEQLNEYLEDKDPEENVEFKIEINKTVKSGIIDVFNEEVFFVKMNSYSLEAILFIFSELKKNVKCEKEILLVNHDTNNSFKTRWINYLPVSSVDYDHDLDTSIEEHQLKICNEKCYFPLNEYLKFIPLDFRVKAAVGLTSELEFLKKILIVYCVGFVFDICIFNKSDNYISSKINGYKTISLKIKYENISTVYLDTYFSIYRWVYENEKVEDKLGLARNVLSLYLKNSSIEIDGNAVNSIYSNYQLYLRDNIKSYIEVKKNISEGLVSLTEKATKITETHVSSLQKSILAFLSLFSSIVIIRVLKNDGFQKILNFESTIFVLLFLFFSFLYLLYSNIEISIEKERLSKSYEELKNRYFDLLVPKDIDQITNRDRKYNDELEYIKKKVFRTNVLWSIILFLFLICTIFIYCNND